VSKIKINVFQNDGQDGSKDGSSKLELPITEPFMNQFGLNLNCRLLIFFSNWVAIAPPKR